MNAPLIVLLRLVHILAGIFWLGATLTLAAFLLPAMRDIGPSAGPFMRQVMQARRLRLWINISMTLAILAGFALYGIDSATSAGVFARSATGKVLGLGALFAIVAAGFAGAMSQPAGNKLNALSERLAEAQRTGAANPSDILGQVEALRTRISRGLTISAVLLLLSATTMAIARYL